MIDASRHVRSLHSFAEHLAVRVERAPLPACVHGRTRADRITILPSLSAEEELATLIHELAHWLVHRPLDAPFSQPQTTLYEYEAEAVEALVLGRLGFDDTGRAAADPVARFDEDPTASLLAASVRRVRLAAERLCGVLALGALEAQAAVDLEAAAREEIVLENEAHRMRDFVGAAQPL
jgi:hypothetical protein